MKRFKVYLCYKDGEKENLKSITLSLKDFDTKNNTYTCKLVKEYENDAKYKTKFQKNGLNMLIKDIENFHLERYNSENLTEQMLEHTNWSIQTEEVKIFGSGINDYLVSILKTLDAFEDFF